MERLYRLLPLFLLLLTACAQNSLDDEPAVPYNGWEAPTLTSKDFSFSPDVLTVPAGKMADVCIMNSGLHTFTVDELGIHQRLAPGMNTVMFTVSEPGTFEYYCAIPGHRERGMVGTLEVR